MLLIRFLHLLLPIALIVCSQARERKLHRLIGGHLKVLNPSPEDSELLDANSSGSKEKTTKNEDSSGNEEEKKTLSQQVADGKYGLIQRELFKKPLKQPGIISYDPNPEIPKDNIGNLGGLTKEEIWLAENHLLVLKGGNYPKDDNKVDNAAILWPAIDNYTAPKRPVKIPSNPKVPPPFPVQLTEDGPLQILGTNSSRTLDGPPPVFALPSGEGGYVPGTGPFFPQHPDQAHAAPGGAPNKNAAKAPGEVERGPPFPPYMNGTLPPFFAHLPPGAVAVPPPSINDFDEDDPSIYYPPPYSFSYPSRDNSSLVPAGPLVPGIILPPPPDFFAPLDTPSTKRPTKRPKPQKTTQPSPHIHPTTTPLAPTTVISLTLRKPIKVAPNNPKDINNELKPDKITTTSPPRTYTYPSRTRLHTKRPAVTILKPVKTVSPHRTYYNHDTSSGKPFEIYGPPVTTSTPKTIISTTQVPLKHYYSTSNDINSNVVTITPVSSTAKPAEYYYYEEEPQTNSITTQSNKIVQNFFNLPDQYYEAPRQVRPPNTQYIYVTSKPKPKYNLVQQQNVKQDSFGLHLSKLRKQIQFYTSPKPAFREIHSPRPVYQYSFQAANYKSQRQNDFKPSQPESPSDDDVGFRPMPKYSVQIQPAIEIPSDQQLPNNPIYFKQSFKATTESPSESKHFYTTTKPSYNYQENSAKRGRNMQKPSPISQYSFDTNQDYRGFYVKPEDSYSEDGHQYSTFGQRIPAQTTPLPSVRYSTRSPKVVYITANNNVPRQKPYSLEDDTLVNYVHPRPNVNPDAEFIQQRPNYPQVAKYVPRPYSNGQSQNYNAQSQNYNVQSQNYNRPHILNAIPINVPNQDAQRGSFISYTLPGDNGAHFYFLTPQLAQRRDQSSSFYYAQADDRLRRSSDNQKR